MAPLDAVEAAFIQLAHHTAYAVDGRQLGSAAGALRLDEVREELREANYTARDAVLGWLVAHARQDAGWRLAIAGVLLPGLRRAAGELTRRFLGNSWDLEAELLTGFLEAVARDDGQPPKVASRLVWAAFRHTWRVRHRDAMPPRSSAGAALSFCSLLRQATGGVLHLHPVPQRLVAHGAVEQLPAGVSQTIQPPGKRAVLQPMQHMGVIWAALAGRYRCHSPFDQGVCSVLNIDATVLRQLQQLGRTMTPGGRASRQTVTATAGAKRRRPGWVSDHPRSRRGSRRDP